jgi:prepilin-type N-terminal cleavage/methylation domain-containing protein
VRNRLRIGYTLVEVVVALLVFSVAALALAASSAIVAKTMESNALRERAARIAANRIELITSECGSAASGAETLQGIQSAWSISRAGALLSILESTRYVSASGSRDDSYRALEWCSP